MLALPLVAFGVFSYVTFSRTLTHRIDEFLGDALTVFRNELFVERRQLPDAGEAIRTTVREVRFRDLAIVVFGEEGRVVASSTAGPRTTPARLDQGTIPVPDIAAAMDERGGRKTWVATLRSSGGSYRVSVGPLALSGSTFRVAGVYPLADVEKTLGRIRALFFLMVPLLVLAAGAGGWYLAHRGFRPVSRMADRASEIGATTLHERLPVVADDELGALARVFNDLLDRLQESFERQRRFMADASHELRSPTAILRTETDVALSRQHRSEEEYRESLTVIGDAVRRLTRVVDDLFLLARADSGHQVMHTVPLYLDEVVRDTVRTVRPLADRKSVEVEVSGSVETSFRGDPDLLGRLLLNLLDNAIEHSPEGETVRVTMAVRGEVVEIRVADRGAGVPAEARDRIFERFFRVDPSRSRKGAESGSGAGLGLAIGRRIAEMHGGRLELAGSPPGRTEFLLVLPAEEAGPT